MLSAIEKIKITLSTAIEAHGEILKELEIRKPLGRDVRKYGFPYSIDSFGRMIIDTMAGAGYIESLAGIPPSAVDSLSAIDFQTILMEIISFFGNAPKTS